MAEQVVGLRFVVEGAGESVAAINNVGKAQDTLAGRIRQGIQRAQQLERQFAALDKAFNSGKVSAQTYSSAIQSLNGEISDLYDENTHKSALMQKRLEEENAERLRLEAMYNKNAAASRVYQQAVSSLSRAVELGVIDDKKRIATLKQIEAAYEMAGKSSAHAQRFITQFGEGAAVAGVKTNRLGMYAQQVGYQVGDFFVQVQSGTDALVAFGQQGTQLAGLLPGLAGAIVGIGLSITTAFLNASLSAKKLTFDYKAFIADLADAVEPIALMLQPLATSFSAVGNVLATSFMFIAQNIDSVIVAAAGASTIFLGSLVPAILGAAKAVGVLTLALLKNPLFLGATVLAAVAVAFYQVVKAVGGLGQAIDAIGKVFSEVFSANNVGAVLDWLSAKFDETWYGLKAVVIGVMADIAEKFAEPFNKLGAIVTGTVEGIRSVMDALPGIIGDAAKRGVNMAIDAFAKMADAALIPINKLIDGVNALGGNVERLSVGGAFDSLKLEVGDGGKSLGAAFSEGFTKGYDDSLIKKPVLDSLRAAEAAAKLSSENAGKAAGVAIGGLKGSATLDGIMSDIANQTGPFSGDYFKPDDKSGKGSSGGASAAEKNYIEDLEREVQLKRDMIGVHGEQKAVMEALIKANEQYDRTLTATESKRVEMAARELYRIEQEAQLRDTVNGHIKSGLMDVVQGTQSVENAFKQMLSNIILAIYEQKVAQPFANAIMAFLPFANGGAFMNGKVTPFATGGVVSSPTLFPMANGAGLMGEAGPEAIMPLKRTRGGKLGVVAEGGGGNVNQTLVFNISANGDESVKRIVQQEAPRIAEQAKAAVLDAKRRGGSYGSKF